jgi:hypothetical protein
VCKVLTQRIQHNDRISLQGSCADANNRIYQRASKQASQNLQQSGEQASKPESTANQNLQQAKIYSNQESKPARQPESTASQNLQQSSEQACQAESTARKQGDLCISSSS